MTLYHYTTAVGLQGIIGSKSLWTTHYRFLNDSSEFQFGWQFVIDALDRREQEIKKLSDFAWMTIELFLKKIDTVYAFVGSLTSQGDLLSQWRGYNRGQGFAIGFNEDWLEKNATPQNFQVSSVLYNKEEQRAAADGVAELLIEQLTSPGLKGEELVRINAWKLEAVKTALRLKDHHFSEEQESRLVWVANSWPWPIKTRIAPRGLVPYRAFQFDLEKLDRGLVHPSNFGIEEIILGPALETHQAVAVEALLASQKMRLPINRSAIPYVAD